MFIRISWLILLVFIAQFCSNDTADNKLLVNKIQFLLTDGSSISNDFTDDYNPVVLVKPNGNLILLFGSNRSGTHAIHAATSVGPYSGFGSYPAFNVPVILQDMTPVNITSTSRIFFTAQFNASSLEVYLTLGNGTIYKADYDVNLVSSIASGYSTIGSHQGKVLNIMNTQGSRRVYFRNNQDQVQYFDPDASTNAAVDLINASISQKGTVAFIPDAVSFDSEAYFYTNWDPSGFFGYVLGGTSFVDYIGELVGLNQNFIDLAGPSFIYAYYDATTGINGFVFSAGDTYDSMQNLYAVNTHDLFQLWSAIQDNGFIFDSFAPNFFDPELVGDLRIWLSAFFINDLDPFPLDTTTFSDWQDFRVPSTTITSTLGANPAFAEDPFFTFTPAVSFDGATQGLQIGNIGTLWGTTTTVFIVMADNGSSSVFNSANASILRDSTTSQDIVRTPSTGSLLETDLLTSSISVNGSGNADFFPVEDMKIVTIQGDFNADPSSSTIQIGNNGTNFFDGLIVEILIYNAALNAQDIYDVECYLSDQYFLFIPGCP